MINQEKKCLTHVLLHMCYNSQTFSQGSGIVYQYLLLQYKLLQNVVAWNSNHHLLSFWVSVSQGFRQGTKGAGFLTVPYLGPQQGNLKLGSWNLLKDLLFTCGLSMWLRLPPNMVAKGKWKEREEGWRGRTDKQKWSCFIWCTLRHPASLILLFWGWEVARKENGDTVPLSFP